jgi:hypothetical protein
MANILNNPSYGEGHQVILKENLSGRLVIDFKKYNYISGKTIFTMTKKTASPKIELALTNDKSFINFIDDKKRIVKMFGSGSAFNSTFNHIGSKGGKSDTNKLTEVKELISICVFEQFLRYNKKVDYEFVNKFLPINLRGFNQQEYVNGAHLQLNTWLKNESGKFKGNYSYERQMFNLTKGMYDNVKKLTGLQKDNWNPGDMWLIKSGFKMDKYEKSESVSDINKMLIEDYNKQNLVGISLKQINPNQVGRIDYINLSTVKKKEADFDFQFSECDFTADTFKNAIIYTKSGFGVRMGFKASTENYGVYLEGRFKGAGSQVGGMDAKKIPDEMQKRYNYIIRKGGTPDLKKEEPIALEEMKRIFKRHPANKISNKLTSYKHFLEEYEKSPKFKKGRLCRIVSFMYPYLELAFQKNGEKEFKDLMNWSFHLSKKETAFGGFYIFLGP